MWKKCLELSRKCARSGKSENKYGLFTKKDRTTRIDIAIILFRN